MIQSAGIAELTSPTLDGLKVLINEAAVQRAALEPEYEAAISSRLRAWRKLQRRRKLPLCLFMWWAVPGAETKFNEADEEARKVATALAASRIQIDFAFEEATRKAYGALESAFGYLAQSARIWDVTAANTVDRVRTRSAASTGVDRTLVRFDRVGGGIVSSAVAALRLENANGGDLEFLPAFLMMRSRASSDYALVDLREMVVRAIIVPFVEEEAIPADAKISSYTWAKTNKNGSRDMRFANNYQIPIVHYGEISFSSSNGVNEVYHVSNAEAALAFGRAFESFQRALAAEMQREPETAGGALIEPLVAADAIELPSLPNVTGAYGVVLLFLAAVAGLAYFSVQRDSDLAHVPTSVPGRIATSPPAESTPATAQPVARPHVTQIPVGPATPPTAKSGAATPQVRPLVDVPSRRTLVTIANVNVRSGPGASYAVSSVMRKGTVVLEFERRDGWVMIGDAKPWGWVRGDFLADGANQQ